MISNRTLFMSIRVPLSLDEDSIVSNDQAENLVFSSAGLVHLDWT